MKRSIAILLAALLLLSLAACGSSGSSHHVKDDKAVLALSFTPPAEYQSVYRFIDKDADGKLQEKDLVYKIDDDTSIGYAVIFDKKLADLMDVSDKDSIDVGGIAVYQLTGDTYRRAVAEKDGNVYAVAYQFAKDGKTDAYDDAMKEITFTDATETTLNDDPENLGGVSWKLDEAWTLLSVSSQVTENADGEMTEKACKWALNDDKENPDTTSYSFGIRVQKNTKLADVQTEGKTYVEKEVGGVTYSVEKDEEKPYIYYVQRGEDVYTIMNEGVYNGLWYNRSDESFTAFETFLNSISFS